MGEHLKFDKDKSYQVIAYTAFVDLYNAVDAAQSKDGKPPQIEFLIKGSDEKRVVIPPEHLAEVLEILRLSIGDA